MLYHSASSPVTFLRLAASNAGAPFRVDQAHECLQDLKTFSIFIAKLRSHRRLLQIIVLTNLVNSKNVEYMSGEEITRTVQGELMNNHKRILFVKIIGICVCAKYS